MTFFQSEDDQPQPQVQLKEETEEEKKKRERKEASKRAQVNIRKQARVYYFISNWPLFLSCFKAPVLKPKHRSNSTVL